MGGDTGFHIPLWLDLMAVVVGAVQGAVFSSRIAYERHIDMVGVCIIGISTGLGGGIVRDLLLDEPPLALSRNAYVLTAIVAALGGMFLAELVNRVDPVVVALDAASLGLYLVVGMVKANGLGLAVVPVAFVGVTACTAGTIIRDILMRNQVSLVRVGSFYAAAAAIGAVTFLLVDQVAHTVTASVAAILVTFCVRMLALSFGWRTPRPHSLQLEAKRARQTVWWRRALRRPYVRPSGRGGPPAAQQEPDDQPDGQADDQRQPER